MVIWKKWLQIKLIVTITGFSYFLKSYLLLLMLKQLFQVSELIIQVYQPFFLIQKYEINLILSLYIKYLYFDILFKVFKAI
jgi:hypothetical protein